MNKQSAEQLIGSTFNYPFDENRFQNFIINFLNFDTNKEFDFVTGSYIRHSFADQIKKYKRLGTYTDPNDKKVDILIVELKNEWSLERSRTMLRNFISDYLKNRDEKDAALVAFYTSNPEDWRFSYIQMEYTRVKINGKFKIEEKITPAKRYSYLVGKNEPNHTAQSQLVGILADDINNPTLSQLENAFSVDNVSIQFYRDYRDQFEKLCNELNKIVKNDKKVEKEFLAKSVDTSNFAKKLMGQIVFLYFLQKKGWLGVDKNEKGNFNNWGTGPKNFLRRLFNKEFTDYKNFFNEVLEPLFYEALATERPNDIFSRFNCKIPFLNGGLFEPINEYNWEETEVTISNKLIESILNTFDQYNFTVREDEPLEKEVAVDPEMLGLVFENLLPENIRKGKGAFYTPRPIVHYMCQESLINYLHNECNQVPNSDIETLVHEGDVILELETAIVEKNKKYESVLMDSIKNNATILDDALANIKVCDPAVGSGAFPVGLMTEIVKARNILSLYIKNNNNQKKRSKYNLKRHCIQNSLYGVDIDSGAIEIAKLRLWLSLIVDEDDYANIEPLPNLDYKIMQGNSLIEEFHGVSFDLEKKPESQQDIFDDNNNLDLLIKDLHNKILEQSNSKHHKDKKLKKEAVEKTFLKILHFVLAKKKDYSKKIASEIEIDLLEITKGKKERNFFPWKLYFADVFREKGGFDIVIGNPPFISYYARRSAKLDTATLRYYQKHYNFITETKLDGKFNTIMFFIEKACHLSNINANVFYIMDVAFNDVPYRYIRKYLIDNTTIKKVITGLSDFENVYSDQILLQFSNTKYTDGLSDNVEYYKGIKSSPRFIFNQSIWKSNRLFEFNPPTNNETAKIYSKMELFPKLGEIFPSKFIRTCMSLAGHEDEFLSRNNNSIKNKPVLKYIQNAKNFSERYSQIVNPESVVYDEDLRDKLNKYYRKDAYNDVRRQPKALGLGSLHSYLSPKIFVRQSADKIITTYTEEHCAANTSFYIINNSNEEGVEIDINLKYITGILNSKILSYYALSKNIIITGNKKQPQMMIKPFKMLPIPRANENTQKVVVSLVDFILLLKKVEKDSVFFECLIDAIVYELYLPEEIIAGGAAVLKHLTYLPELKKGLDENNLKTIENVYNELSNPKHPICAKLLKLLTIKEIKIVEDSAIK